LRSLAEISQPFIAGLSKMIALSKTLLRAMTVAAFGAAAVLTASPSRAEGGAFADYAGSWSGTGTISIAQNQGTSSERIRCKGTYTVEGGGNTLHQSLRCASDSYRFDLTSNVRASGGQLTGDWSEASRNVNGTVNGQVSGGDITARVETNGYVASFNVSTRGGKQTVAISSPGELRAVNIALSRGK
jgi:hypothetical protein